MKKSLTKAKLISQPHGWLINYKIPPKQLRISMPHLQTKTLGSFSWH